MASLKRISGIILCVFAILLMSHNANAIEIYGSFTRDYNYNSGGIVWYGATSDADDAWHTNLGFNNNNGGISFTPGNNVDISYVTRIVLTYTNSWGANALANIPYRICFDNPSNMTAFVGFSGNGYSSVISNETQYTAAGCIVGQLNVFVQKNINNIYLGGGDGGTIIGSLPYGGSFTIVFGKTTFLNLQTLDYTTVLNNIKNNTDDIKSKLDEIAESADAALDREQSETQDAADDSSSAGSSSSSDATAATSSLISVIGGFVNVLTSAQPTNCKINANLNHIDMGQLDLCANPVPSYIQIIGSIILICAAIPLAIVLFNRFIGLFRSFQG